MTAPVPDVSRIAVLRANALGDFLFVLPALEALRAAYPAAELVLLGAPWHARWLTGRPSPVDRVLVVPPAEGIHDAPAPTTMPDFLAAAGREGFDLALQLHGGGRHSNPLVSALGARLTAGLRATDAPPLDRWLRYVFYQPEIIRYLEAVALVGAAPVTLTPTLALTAGDLVEARAVAGAPERPRAALHPGVSDPRRRWPPHRFVAVADALVAMGFEVVLTGTESERPLVEQVRAAARAPVRPLVGALTLGGLAGLYAECAVVVANDTGPLHLAAAVGTPTVGIFWVGNMITVATPLRGRHRALTSWIIHCPVCGADCTRDLYPCRPGEGCGHRESFVADVPVAEVLEAVADLTCSGGAQPHRLGKEAADVVR
ncbi:ADP-heptose:LPS heptosyltransferase [Micromonospora pattaloongensis]|uniref:ADP-heptose:LPS heptosyltransferase n=1 Tax=Micromonospora pattaloongensis TaxID=405436 RepID=A0A1H3SLK3_9ACTN|nr:glycosyltransferase family 9 protein [Micromonospora pattaloongensis]SDZ38953.1 ADP-heptose:LPS heptosyltransferase [Micromonospora pattaloongensis]